MQAEEIKQFLSCLGVTKTDSRRKGWVTASCPLGPSRHGGGKDSNPSFGVKIEAGESRCHCFSCDWSGSQSDLVFAVMAQRQVYPSEKKLELGKALGLIEDHEGELPTTNIPTVDEQLYGVESDYVFPEEWLQEFDPAYFDGEVHPYLVERGMPYSVAKAFDMRWDATKNRVCFPIRDYKGQLRGLHGRSIWPNSQLPYLMYPHKPHPEAEGRTNPDVWFGEHEIDPEKPVVAVESVFDRARVYQVYRNVMCPLSAGINAARMKRLDGITELITLFDNDKAGRQAQSKLSYMAKWSTISFMLSLEHLMPEGHDPGKLSVEQVAEILTPYVELDDFLLE